MTSTPVRRLEAVQEGVSSAFWDFIRDRDLSTLGAIEDGCGAAFARWLEAHTAELVEAIAGGARRDDRTRGDRSIAGPLQVMVEVARSVRPGTAWHDLSDDDRRHLEMAIDYLGAVLACAPDQGGAWGRGGPAATQTAPRRTPP